MIDTEEVPLAVRPAEGVDAVSVEVEEVGKKKKKKKRSAEEAIATEEATVEPMDIGKYKSNTLSSVINEKELNLSCRSRPECISLQRRNLECDIFLSTWENIFVQPYRFGVKR